MFAFGRCSAFAATFAVAMASCGSCKEETAVSEAGELAVVEADGASPRAGNVVATVHEPIDVLVAGRGQLFALSRERGTLLAIAIGSDSAPTVKEIARGEHDPSALVVRAGKPVWLSHDGIFACNEDGGQRRAVVERAGIVALGSGPHGIVFADEHGIYRVEWPAAATPIVVVPGVMADEVAATSEKVLWIERGPGSVWSYDLKSGTRTQLMTDLRRPRDLAIAADDRSVSWHEGAGDMFGGRSSRGFLADSVTSSVREISGTWASSAGYLVRGPCVYGPGVCKPVTRVDWITQDPAAKDGPIAADAVNFYWADPGLGNSWRVVSVAQANCSR